MVEALKQAGAPHRFHRYEKLRHLGNNEEVVTRTLEFIQEHSALPASPEE